MNVPLHQNSQLVIVLNMKDFITKFIFQFVNSEVLVLLTMGLFSDSYNY